MDGITWLSKKTMNIINYLKIFELFDQNDYTKVENLIKKYRKKEVKITESQLKQLAENGLLIFWSEIIKYIIVLTIAKLLGIFWETFWIMNIFSTLRALAGGVHMSSFNKCFAVMIYFFLLLGYLASQIYMDFMTINIIYVICMFIAYKYSPQEREDKTDKDCTNGNKRKMLVMMFVYIYLLISLINYYYYNNLMISNVITIGVLLEMFTVTPMGIKLFKWIDKIGEK